MPQIIGHRQGTTPTRPGKQVNLTQHTDCDVYKWTNGPPFHLQLPTFSLLGPSFQTYAMENPDWESHK